jgi:hypothetical protein
MRAPGAVIVETVFTRIFQPVKRQGAERFVRLTLVAFAASVIITRLYLTLTGFPQLGSGTFHIAHLLWGGLLLFIAALLPLILANRWVYSACGILGGVGVGLFIDEVGKFITRNNDYFYPAAAPIIYAFFLITVLIYMQVRRPPSNDHRAELYRVFEDMSEVLDHDLDAHERADLETRLAGIAQDTIHPDYARLAQVLNEFLNSDAVRLARPQPGLLARFSARVRVQRDRWLTRRRLKAILVTGLMLGGLLYVFSLGASLAAYQMGLTVDTRAPVPAATTQAAIQATADPGAADPAPVTTPAAGSAKALPTAISRTEQARAAGTTPETDLPPNSGPVHPAARTFRARAALWLRDGLGALVGFLLLIGAGLLMGRHERRGVQLGIYGLLLALTTVDLLIFYFSQFSAVTEALIQYVMLEGLVFYRRRFVLPPAQQ